MTWSRASNPRASRTCPVWSERIDTLPRGDAGSESRSLLWGLLNRQTKTADLLWKQRPLEQRCSGAHSRDDLQDQRVMLPAA